MSLRRAHGLGIRLSAYRGNREIGHYGGGLGYGALVRLLPDNKAGVLILANRMNALLNGSADAALDLALSYPASRSHQTPDTAATLSLAPREIALLQGTYRNALDEPLVFRSAGGELVLEDDEPLPVRRAGPKTLAVLTADGQIAQKVVTVIDRRGCVTYLYFLGRAFRREGACPH